MEHTALSSAFDTTRVGTPVDFEHTLHNRLHSSFVTTPHLSSQASSPKQTSFKSILSVFPTPFSAVYRDFRARLPFYLSDWSDAWNYRVVPATTFTFFSNVLPGIAFSLDLIETTNQYGVTEVLIASFMAAFVFSIFGAQPLCIAGVTGPITVLNKTIFDIIKDRPDAPNYLQFIGWVYLWGAILHVIAAALSWCNLLRYVTRFSCDTFGFFVAWVYLQYGVQILTRQLKTEPSDAAYLAILLAILMTVVSFLFQFASATRLFRPPVRRFLSDYGMPISIVATTAMAYWGRFHKSNPSRLPISKAFQAANGRSWLVRFWELDGKWIGIAFPFGFILFILFFFDHNVSSLISQGSEFPLKKPPGFHYDFLLLGMTTFIAGLIGVPAPNGLIPQAPIHTRSLLVLGEHPRNKESVARDEEKGVVVHEGITSGDPVPIGVVEQRVSNLAQGASCLILLTGPFLHVLHLIPRGVLAGLFWYMGLDALASSGVTQKILYLCRDRQLVDPKTPFRCVRASRMLLFISLELLGFGATMAIVQTKAAIGFPVVIALLVPLRTWVIPSIGFSKEELGVLDGPTASPFTMMSVGGIHS